MPTYRLTINGRTRELDISAQGDRLHIAERAAATDGASAAVPLVADARLIHREQAPGGLMLIELSLPDGSHRRVRLSGMREGDRRKLWIDGRELSATRARPGAAPAAAEGSLASAIPAVVSRLLLAPGDDVRAGDRLLLLESMKMVIPIQAPRDGRLARYLCAEGDAVPAGVPLVELEPL